MRIGRDESVLFRGRIRDHSACYAFTTRIAGIVPKRFMNSSEISDSRKMLVTTLLICGAVLCVAIAALFTFQVLTSVRGSERRSHAGCHHRQQQHCGHGV